MNNLIAPEIVAKCMDPVEQEKIDQLMVSQQFVMLNFFDWFILDQLCLFQLTLDGTDNKNKLGANAILGVSMAVCKVNSELLNTAVYPTSNTKKSWSPWIYRLAQLTKVFLSTVTSPTLLG